MFPTCGKLEFLHRILAEFTKNQVFRICKFLISDSVKTDFVLSDSLTIKD